MDTMQRAWVDAFMHSLNGWPGDNAAYDLWYAYLGYDGKME